MLVTLKLKLNTVPLYNKIDHDEVKWLMYDVSTILLQYFCISMDIDTVPLRVLTLLSAYLLQLIFSDLIKLMSRDLDYETRISSLVNIPISALYLPLTSVFVALYPISFAKWSRCFEYGLCPSSVRLQIIISHSFVSEFTLFFRKGRIYFWFKIYLAPLYVIKRFTKQWESRRFKITS